MINNPRFYDLHTIKWLRRQVNEKVMERSVNTLIMKNEANRKNRGKMVNSDEKDQENLTPSYFGPKDKFINKKMKPKYIFTQGMLNKLKKLKEIFLDFDKNKSGKSVNNIKEN